jgi:hypothetical protein
VSTVDPIADRGHYKVPLPRSTQKENVCGKREHSTGAGEGPRGMALWYTRWAEETWRTPYQFVTTHAHAIAASQCVDAHEAGSAPDHEFTICSPRSPAATTTNLDRSPADSTSHGVSRIMQSHPGFGVA